MSLPEYSPLGKPSAYKTEYDASLLFPIPRQPKRTEIGLPEGKPVPFFGVDIWNAYELSWLNLKGKPQVALATFIIPSDTPNIVESKSFKLYLNSFNQTRIASPEALQQLLHHDLSEATGGTVQVRLVTEADIRGDLHTHTDLTDGVSTLEEMLAAARKRGHRYYAVTDHAKNMPMQRMTDAKMLAQRRRL